MGCWREPAALASLKKRAAYSFFCASGRVADCEMVFKATILPMLGSIAL